MCLGSRKETVKLHSLAWLYLSLSLREREREIEDKKSVYFNKFSGILGSPIRTMGLKISFTVANTGKEWKQTEYM